jgi:hypothetical protein
VITRVPAGDAIVLALVTLIAALAFSARSWEARRVRAAQAVSA